MDAMHGASPQREEIARAVSLIALTAMEDLRPPQAAEVLLPPLPLLLLLQQAVLFSVHHQLRAMKHVLHVTELGPILTIVEEVLAMTMGEVAALTMTAAADIALGVHARTHRLVQAAVFGMVGFARIVMLFAEEDKYAQEEAV